MIVINKKKSESNFQCVYQTDMQHQVVFSQNYPQLSSQLRVQWKIQQFPRALNVRSKYICCYVGTKTQANTSKNCIVKWCLSIRAFTVYFGTMLTEDLNNFRVACILANESKSKLYIVVLEFKFELWSIIVTKANYHT